MLILSNTKTRKETNNNNNSEGIAEFFFFLSFGWEKGGLFEGETKFGGHDPTSVQQNN
jgi:hypothetical protein